MSSSVREKRIILSSWASDMFAVESCPALREIPGMGRTIRLADILASCPSWTAKMTTRRRAGAYRCGRRAAEGDMMFAQAVLTIVLLGNAAAAWTVPLVALMVPRKRGEPERSAL